jgi:sigma-E factor negative regulatory protein RseA
MSIQIDTPIDQETVSALMDGQLRDADLSAALRGMEAAEARQSWLVYHLVGDVLRSADLAHGRHDLALAERVRQRLGAQEPSAEPAGAPVAAPNVSRPAANDGVFRWKLVAGLASLAALAAIGWGAWSGADPAPAGTRVVAQVFGARALEGPLQVASLPAVPPPVAVASMTDEQPALVGQVMLRDPRLDELLAAHRAAAGVSALDNTAGFLRNATFQEGDGR